MNNHRTARGAERLRSLRDAAATMFLEQGFDAVSLDTLIAQVGGSRRNIYSHFGGKEGLFIEALTERCAELAIPLEELDISGPEPREALSRFGCKILEIVLTPRALALHRLMVAEGQRFPELSQSIWHAGHSNATNLLARWFLEKQSERLIRADMSAENLAAQFISIAVTTPQLRCLIGLDQTPSPALIARIMREAVSVFLAGALIDAERV